MGVVTPEPERFTEGIRNEAAGVPEDVRVLGVITLEDVVERMVPHACMRGRQSLAANHPGGAEPCDHAAQACATQPCGRACVARHHHRPCSRVVRA
jgi:hypothetical protein